MHFDIYEQPPQSPTKKPICRNINIAFRSWTYTQEREKVSNLVFYTQSTKRETETHTDREKETERHRDRET